MIEPGVRLLHLKTDVEQITPATTLSAIGSLSSPGPEPGRQT